MPYTIELKPSAYRILSKLPKEVQRSIRSRIDSLADNPFPPNVKKLMEEQNLYRIRVGDYWIVYQVNRKTLFVLVVTIGHRREVYKRLKR